MLFQYCVSATCWSRSKGTLKLKNGYLVKLRDGVEKFIPWNKLMGVPEESNPAFDRTRSQFAMEMEKGIPHPFECCVLGS